MMNGLRWFPIVAALMAASTLESEAAFKERALQIGIEERHVEKFVEKRFAAFGRYAFAVVYSPHHTDEAPLRRFLTELLEEEPSLDQLSCMRRLFFEAHTMALTDARQRVEASPDPGMATRKLATAERVARQKEQESRLGGLVFTPETTPSNYLVDLFVEMCETGVLSYIKPEQCCSRAQEVSAVRRDPTVSTDALGMLKLGAKTMDPTCEANTELKLRACWQRRNLAMDLAGLASFEVVEGWVQFLFLQLLREQPRGFAKISLQQILDCDKQLFTLASHRTMGNLQKGADEAKPLDTTINSLKESSEILQYLMPLPATRTHEAPALQVAALKSSRRPTRVATKVATRGLERQAATRRYNFLKVVPLMMMSTNLCALHSRTTSASSRDRLGSVVPVGSISVTRKGATGLSLTTCAPIQTDLRRRQQQFHKRQFHEIHLPYLWKSLQDGEPFLRQPYKLGCEL